jgi:hypothetical protein
MTAQEIQDKLLEAANFTLAFKNGFWVGFGSINNFDCCKMSGGIGPFEYRNYWYPKHKKMLEDLPWHRVVENPRMPKPIEYPTEEGLYLTMLDCDEHAVWVNEFKHGNWTVYDRTHVKWWMPLPLTEKDLEHQELYEKILREHETDKAIGIRD